MTPVLLSVKHIQQRNPGECLAVCADERAMFARIAGGEEQGEAWAEHKRADVAEEVAVERREIGEGVVE